MDATSLIAVVGSVTAGVVTIIGALGKELRENRRVASEHQREVTTRLQKIENAANGSLENLQARLAAALAKIETLEARLGDKG